MGKIYYQKIRAGKMTFEDVPKIFQKKTKDYCAEMVDAGEITPEQYEEITKEEYAVITGLPYPEN